MKKLNEFMTESSATKIAITRYILSYTGVKGETILINQQGNEISLDEKLTLTHKDKTSASKALKALTNKVKKDIEISQSALGRVDAETKKKVDELKSAQAKKKHMDFGARWKKDLENKLAKQEAMLNTVKIREVKVSIELV